MAQTLYRLGLMAMESGDDVQAGTLLEQSTILSRQLRDPIGIADNLCTLAVLALRQQNNSGALAALKESLVLFDSVGNLERIGQCLALGASYVHANGDLNHAVMLLGASDCVWRQAPQVFQLEPEVSAEYDRLLPLVRLELADAEFQAVWAIGQQMTIQQAVANVLAIE